MHEISVVVQLPDLPCLDSWLKVTIYAALALWVTALGVAAFWMRTRIARGRNRKAMPNRRKVNSHHQPERRTKSTYAGNGSTEEGDPDCK